MTIEVYNKIVGDLTNRLFSSAVRASAVSGLVSPDHGVTKPLPKVNSLSEAFSYMSSYLGEQSTKQGGAAMDSYFDPKGTTYRDRRYEFLKAKEAERLVAYDDATGKSIAPGKPKKGNITVGIGFNMDRANARQSFEQYLPGVSFDDVYSGKRKLTPSESQKLFDYTAQEAENIVNAKFKGVKLSEHQRLALVSMAFNGPSLLGPELIRAVAAGDTAGAVNQILNKSNRKANKGLASRRYHEARLFAGTDQADSLIPNYAEYMAKFG